VGPSQTPPPNPCSPLLPAEPLPEKPSFRQQVAGNAKKFAGKTFGHEHEVAQGEALLAGESKEEARVAAEHVKQQQAN